MGCHDKNQEVREATFKALKKLQNVDMISQAYEEKQHQKMTIICAIKEIFEDEVILPIDLRSFLSEILNEFEGGKENSFYNKMPHEISQNESSYLANEYMRLAEN